MMTPGSFGTLYIPYDFSAFRPVVNDDNKSLRSWHTWYCELAEEGSRFRNNCDVMSPWNQAHVLALDTEYVHDSYAVDSAFHGATIYPYEQLIASKASYDSGSDGQRCEHVGFNIKYLEPKNWDTTLNTTNFATKMFINPKWTLNLAYERPGGPTGARFASLMVATGVNSQIFLTLFCALTSNTLLCLSLALLIKLIVNIWKGSIRSALGRRLTVLLHLNANDLLPGGLDGGGLAMKRRRIRKNTNDDDAALFEMLRRSDEDFRLNVSSGSVDDDGNNDTDEDYVNLIGNSAFNSDSDTDSIGEEESLFGGSVGGQRNLV
jgi:hypothetical protein